MIEAIGGRKFIFAMMVTILSFVLVLVGKLMVNEYLNFVEVIGGLYVIGNVTSAVAERINVK
jgi:hypothetical protein